MTIEKIRFKEKVAYGCGDAASSMFWKLLATFLPIFYTDVFGITTAAVATMVFITRTWDAGFDPFVGVLADRTETRWGKFRPYLLWVAIPFGVLGVLLFTTPHFTPAGKLVYAYVTFSLMWVAYSMINVPYASLMGVMTSDGVERTSLATFRFIFAFGGSILVFAIFGALTSFFSKFGGVERGWQLAAVVIALLAVGFFLFTFYGTKERLKPIAEPSHLASDLKDLCRNWPWFILLGAGISTIFFNSIRDGVALYFFKYSSNLVGERTLFSLNLLEKEIAFVPSAVYLVIGQAANILGVLLATPISMRIGKKATYICAMVVAAIFSSVFQLLDSANLAGIFVVQAIISVAAGVIFPLLWSMYADTADYSEWKTGRRATGLVFSASSMTQKFGGAIGGWVVLMLLGHFGYMANLIQTERSMQGIRLMLSYIPALGAGMSAFFMLFYPLNEKVNQKMAEELAERRSVARQD